MKEHRFDIDLHHGGKFIDNPMKQYIGGPIDVIKNLDLDEIATTKIKKFVKLHGY